MRQRLERVADLHRQLTGRAQDERAGLARRRGVCRRPGGSGSAGRRRGSCRSRYGHGRGRPCRPGRPGWSRPGSGTASVTPSRASALDEPLGQAERGEAVVLGHGHRRLVGRGRELRAGREVGTTVVAAGRAVVAVERARGAVVTAERAGRPVVARSRRSSLRAGRSSRFHSVRAGRSSRLNERGARSSRLNERGARSSRGGVNAAGRTVVAAGRAVVPVELGAGRTVVTVERTRRTVVDGSPLLRRRPRSSVRAGRSSRFHSVRAGRSSRLYQRGARSSRLNERGRHGRRG